MSSTAAPSTAGQPTSRRRAGTGAGRRRPLLGAVVLLALLTHVGLASAVARPAGTTTTTATPAAAGRPVAGRPVPGAAAGAAAAYDSRVRADRTARLPPVPGTPLRRFEAPAHDYGPGHRGVDLPAVPGQRVHAPAAGTVTFAGPVAGRGVVVLQHAGGALTSLEPVRALVPRGTTVAAGAPVATVTTGPPHAGCPTGCLHWGVRVEGRYVDPWWWLGRTGPVRLLPWLQSPFETTGTSSPRASPTGPAPAWTTSAGGVRAL